MSAPPDPAAPNAQQPSQTPGANLRVAVACPHCGAAGWIKWTRLKNGLHCPKCSHEFCISKNGQWLSLREMPQVRYTCPRCGKSGAIPSTSMVRRAECIDCKLPLVAGPDQKLHGVKEAAELHRAARKRTYGKWLAQNLRAKDGRILKWRVALAAAILACGVPLAAAAVRSMWDNSPETLARRFTLQCLEGDWKAALKYLPDDDVQTVEFERWRMRHFTSIVASYRPPGDKPAVTVELIKENDDVRVFRVSISSPFLGTRDYEQSWVRSGERWWFDALDTLAAQDAIGSQAVARRRAAAAAGKAGAGGVTRSTPATADEPAE